MVSRVAGQRCRTATAYIGAWEAHPHVVPLVLLTCGIALMVNFSSFGLIGRTSAITFQVG